MFKTHNQTVIPVAGTFLKGYVHATYAMLVEAFGEPMTGDEYKTDVEWNILFRDGTVAAIYNWKNGPAYCGAEGTPVEQITHWNIGGNRGDAVGSVERVIQSLTEDSPYEGIYHQE